ncbi:Fanconi anemia group D2 protein isoform X1 [Strigops habroptila]|uniref:Fanconi anemia group D2 protein isoform X1 n=1 Tax=Strigops habroptila TaxID=2489341 RepID=UPI0011CF087A|nr:Fanconi anemia group D2 protein isoform X1 [Strigops habroptila]XP_030357811.1 Fanconi anemia group D2 protein isoform X1 [Strigops habroptila]
MVSKRKLLKAETSGENSNADPPSRCSETKKSRISAPDRVETEGIFEELIRTSGIVLKVGEGQNEIAVDQMTFQKKLCLALEKHPAYPGVVKQFISGLESHIKDRNQFKNCLLPCSPIQTEGSRTRHLYCDSLIKLLLGIKILQPAVITLLLEKIPEFFFDIVGTFGTDFPRLIINQFKWLDKFLDSQDLVKKLMQLVSVSPVPIQHDIITSLPEILEDSQQSEVARELSCLLKQGRRLTVPILDALSRLDLDAGLLAEVRQSAMTIVPSVKLEDLPVVVKFILHNVKAADAVEVISDLRKNLDLSSCDLPLKILSSQKKVKSQVQASSSMSQVTTSQNCVKLLFDVIKLAVRFQKEVSEAWIKAIENSTSVSDHKVLDLMVLLLIHSTNTKYGKQAEKLLKSKIRLGCMPEQLMQNAFQNHSLVIKDFFPSILAVAQTFLHSGHPAVVSFGSCMYKQAFAAFDSYCQQEVVTALVTHVCSGNETELDISLDVLTDLVVLHTALLMRYATFVKTILDSTQKLHPCQIRKLFYILSTLAFSQRQEGSYIQDDMHMVIRKWLSSTVPNHKQMGIIGAVTMIGSVALKRNEGDGSSLERPELNSERDEQLSNLLDLVGICCEQTPEVLALYYDEFANLIEKQKGNLDLQLLDKFGKSLVEDFPSDFVVDLGPTVDGSFLFPVKSLYNLDEDETQGAIAINLLPLVSQSDLGRVTGGMSSQSKRVVSPLCLSPCFRLLRFYTAEQNSGSLEEIDALLGCPLYLTNLEVEGKLDSLSKQEREFLCSLLFYALNWFREVVNAFCQQQDAEMKGKVLTRLQNITELQNVLGKCLAATPGYVPPPATFDSEALEAVSSTNAVGPVRKKNGKKKKTDGSKASSADRSQADDSSEGNQPDTELSELEKTTAEREAENPLTKLQNYRPYFRELDLEVFTVLHCGLLTKSVLDTEMHTEFCEVVQLGPTELSFLLDDLCWKLEHVLTPSSTRRVPFLKERSYRDIGFSHLCQRSPKEVATCVVKLLKPLCNHTEKMHSYFQAVIQNQGAEDEPGVNIQEHMLMSSCYQQLLLTFRSLFAWNGFSQPENTDLLRSALQVLAERLKPGETEFLLLEDLISESFHYVLNFQQSVPSFYCAFILTQLLITIAEKPMAGWKKEKIASLAKQFLCQSWVRPSGDREKGNQFNSALHTLLCVYLEHTDNILKAIEEISSVGVPELINSAKDGCSSTYPTLTRQTFLIFFRVMMAQLESSVKSIPAGKPSDSSEVQLEKLLRWNIAVRNFHILINLVKVFDSRPVLGVCLKYGRLFVEAFLKLAMPLLDYSFKKHRDDVQSLLKTLQLSTRQLHHMCGHSKIHQDIGLTNHVPLLKKSLEQFVYRVKAMLAFNHCQEAFWLGVLKNRDLQGEEILSQASGDKGSDEEDSAESPAEELSGSSTDHSDENGAGPAGPGSPAAP